MASILLILLAQTTPFGQQGVDSLLSFEDHSAELGQDSIYHATPGVDDIRDRDFTLYPQFLAEHFPLEYTYENFSTNGHDICVYGEFNLDRSDLWVEFFFIDDKGFEEYSALEVTDRKRNHIANQYEHHEWNEILPSYYKGEYVSTWHLVLSVALAPSIEPAREGNLYTGKDLMAPSIQVNFPSVANGTKSAIITLREYNCELRLVRVWVDDDAPLYEDTISGVLWTGTVPIDTTRYEDGIHILWVWASDTGWASHQEERSFTIRNELTSPITPAPAQGFNLTEILQVFYQNLGNPLTPWIVGLNIFVTIVTIARVKRKSQSSVAPWVVALLAVWLLLVFSLFLGGLWHILSVLLSSSIAALAILVEIFERRSTMELEEAAAYRDRQIEQLRESDEEKKRRIDQLERKLEALGKKVQDNGEEQP